MGTMTAYLRRTSGGQAGWYPRKILRKAGFVPFEVYGETHDGSVVGYIYVNKATLVGSGGSAFTITDTTSTITITE
jgi:hypothetical protein